MQDTTSQDLVDDPWSTTSREPASKGLRLPVTYALPDEFFEKLATLTSCLPTVLLDQTLDMSPTEIWRLVMCNHKFHRTFLNTSSCNEIALGRWSQKLSEGKRMPVVSGVSLGYCLNCLLDVKCVIIIDMSCSYPFEHQAANTTYHHAIVNSM